MSQIHLQSPPLKTVQQYQTSILQYSPANTHFNTASSKSKAEPIQLKCLGKLTPLRHENMYIRETVYPTDGNIAATCERTLPKKWS